jgi:lipid II:glycine glycyltransferase (peptidoglycan interpeptide bridge formation enzyme)
MQIFFTKETSWLQKWDEYIQNSERGLYNQLSDWILFYSNFGFDYELLLLTENEEIVGGCILVIAKASIFKFAIVPCGPILNLEKEPNIDWIIKKLKDKANNLGCCYFQISMPILSDDSPTDFNQFTISNYPANGLYYSGKTGTKFKFVIPLYGMRLIDLRNSKLESLSLNFSKNHKRNYQKALQNELEFDFVSDAQNIKLAYNCFELNAKDKGYGLRDYKSMETMLINLVDKGFAKIGICYLDKKIAGAIYIIKAGNRWVYINGGVLKEFQSLNISHFMHAKIMEWSIQNNMKCYDISVGGSKGVIQFKAGFGSQLYDFIPTRYFVLNSFRFNLYQKIVPFLKNNKAFIAKCLLVFKQKK